MNVASAITETPRQAARGASATVRTGDELRWTAARAARRLANHNSTKGPSALSAAMLASSARLSAATAAGSPQPGDNRAGDRNRGADGPDREEHPRPTHPRSIRALTPSGERITLRRPKQAAERRDADERKWDHEGEPPGKREICGAQTAAVNGKELQREGQQRPERRADSDADRGDGRRLRDGEPPHAGSRHPEQWSVARGLPLLADNRAAADECG